MKPKPQTITQKLSDSHYQPSKAEMEQEYDMPNLSDDEIRDAFFNPRSAGRALDDEG